MPHDVLLTKCRAISWSAFFVGVLHNPTSTPLVCTQESLERPAASRSRRCSGSSYSDVRSVRQPSSVSYNIIIYYWLKRETRAEDATRNAKILRNIDDATTTTAVARRSAIGGGGGTQRFSRRPVADGLGPGPRRGAASTLAARPPA